MHNQCHEQGWGKISRRCFLSAAASVAGCALAGPALAERTVTPSAKLDSTDVQHQSSADPSSLTVACPNCCRALSDHRDSPRPHAP
jgi:hypothetical protein